MTLSMQEIVVGHRVSHVLDKLNAKSDIELGMLRNCLVKQRGIEIGDLNGLIQQKDMKALINNYYGCKKKIYELEDALYEVLKNISEGNQLNSHALDVLEKYPNFDPRNMLEMEHFNNNLLETSKYRDLFSKRKTAISDSIEKYIIPAFCFIRVKELSLGLSNLLPVQGDESEAQANIFGERCGFGAFCVHRRDFQEKITVSAKNDRFVREIVLDYLHKKEVDSLKAKNEQYKSVVNIQTNCIGELKEQYYSLKNQIENTGKAIDK